MNANNTATYEKDQRIIDQGEIATRAFRIKNGSVHVFLEKNGRIITLAELGEGAIFGETALFDNTEYGANVDAKSDCTLEIITPASFQSAIENCDPTLQAIIHMMSDRLRRTNKALLESETREFMDLVFVDED